MSTDKMHVALSMTAVAGLTLLVVGAMLERSQVPSGRTVVQAGGLLAVGAFVATIAAWLTGL